MPCRNKSKMPNTKQKYGERNLLKTNKTTYHPHHKDIRTIKDCCWKPFIHHKVTITFHHIHHIVTTTMEEDNTTVEADKDDVRTTQEEAREANRTNNLCRQGAIAIVGHMGTQGTWGTNVKLARNLRQGMCGMPPMIINVEAAPIFQNTEGKGSTRI